MYDFLVVGAGIAGAAIAYELAASAKVCMLEAEARPGLHATGRSAALYDPSYGGREIRALTRASRGFFDAPPEGFGDHPLLTGRGCLYIARPDQTQALAAMAAEVAATGGALTATSRAEALARVPRLRPDYLAEAIYDAEAMDIDVDGLHQGFLRRARRRGAILKVEAALRSAGFRDGAWRVTTAEGEVSAPALVNAAGAWADEVAQACGAWRLGLQPMRPCWSIRRRARTSATGPW
jgi:D-arginine dehydrogenase